jgi:uncharacterized protein YecT (DUF1311 family)
VRPPIFSALMLLAAASPATAQDEAGCENAIAQQEMNLCAQMDFEAADAVLNVAWRKARAMAKELDAEQPEGLKGADKALLTAQRAWIAYRDGQCELAGFEARGGSMEPMLVSGCKAELTWSRTKELQTFVGGEAQ